MGNPLINEIGNKYGTLTPIELTKDKNGRTAWLCKCDCGKEKIVRGPDLRTGRITTCGAGCPLKHAGNYKNLEGNHFGYLTVLYRKGSTGSNKCNWICRCKCGKITNVTSQSLLSGNTSSCGCMSKELNSSRHIKEENPGTIYGFLQIISKATPFVRQHVCWYTCKCLKCGSIKDYPGTYLRSGNTKSCGCLLSWAEEVIAKILSDNNISYQRQYYFQDLKGRASYLRFDFGIIQNNKLLGLIEYQGEQHYRKISRDTEESYQLRREYDKKKKEYCEQHNIPILYLNKNNNLEKDTLDFIKSIAYEV